MKELLSDRLVLGMLTLAAGAIAFAGYFLARFVAWGVQAL